ncbi:MAG: biopolymer transporter ExbD [Prevotellaceae bacterium]|jgi:biopolymer transport protein ExbD|nr:biopolymer transporter ExbD [Prevotellaceae bacterium]
MAEIQEKDKGDKKKGKQKKMHIHVDFTPMVDMNMLLICFFMLATSMSKPQTMEIVMPAKETQIDPASQMKIADSRAVTVLIDGDNKLYYYEGDPSKTDPKYEDYNTLKESSYGAEGLRSYLIGRNKKVVELLREFKDNRDSIQAHTKNLQKQLNELNEQAKAIIVENKGNIDAKLRVKLDSIATDSYKGGEGSFMDGYKKYVNEIKKSDDHSPIIVIKVSDKATYENLIDVLDEMQICGIPTYTVVDITPQDFDLIENYVTKGEYAKSKSRR